MKVRSKLLAPLAALGMILLLAATPLVEAAQSSQVKTANALPQVVGESSFKLLSETPTSMVLQVDNVLLTYTTDAPYEAATMDIKDLTTGKVQTVKYTTTKKGGKYVTKVDGIDGVTQAAAASLASVSGSSADKNAGYTTSYNPLEPRNIAGSAQAEAASQAASNSLTVTPAAAIGSWDYRWDGNILYLSARTTGKYGHPAYMGASQIYSEYYYTGDKLIHYHIAQRDSQILARAAPVVLFAALGARIGGPAGAVIGGLLGLVGQFYMVDGILDEQGCLWFWYAKNWGFVFLWFNPPTFFTYTTQYFRMSQWTIWDACGAGNPY